jgi:formylglycine-generating enzyme
MLGLVWQWCLDWRGPYPGGHVIDWKGPEFGTTRMNRSGSFGSPKGHGIMSTNRWSTPGVTSRRSLGFRVALSAVP